MAKLYPKSSFNLAKPDDWHVHFREEDSLKDTVTATATHFQRALVMPNLKKPLTTVEAINDYKRQVEPHCVKGFIPYFSLYLTENTRAETFEMAKQAHDVLGAKLYPAGVTTNSKAGVKSLKNLYPVLDLMQSNDLVLQIHGEVPNEDIFDREKLFIERELTSIIQNFPKLRIVLEHVSTKTAVEFICQTSNNIAATITIHHLLYTRNHLLSGGIKPHYYCLPILKRESDQKALIQAALSGNHKFFLGTDSAPHAQGDKESRCGCAGIYSAPFALALYTDFFEKHDALDKLEAFACHFGADFYRLQRNTSTINLVKKPQQVPGVLQLGKKSVVPIEAGNTLSWTVSDDE